MAMMFFFQSGVTTVHGVARFTEDGCVEVDGDTYAADHILIATGSAPVIPKVPGLTPKFLINACLFRINYNFSVAC